MLAVPQLGALLSPTFLVGRVPLLKRRKHGTLILSSLLGGPSIDFSMSPKIMVGDFQFFMG